MYRKAAEMSLGALPVRPPRLPLNADEITATIEGPIGLIISIAEVRFERWVEIWEKRVMLEKGFWDMATSLS